MTPTPHPRTPRDRLITVLLFSLFPLAAVGFVATKYFDAKRQEAAERDERNRMIQESLNYKPPTEPPARTRTPRAAPPLTFWDDKPRPRPAAGWIAFVRNDASVGFGFVRLITPTGELVASVEGFDKDYSAQSVRLSPDGTRLAVTVADRERARDLNARGFDWAMASPTDVLVYDLTAPGPPVARLSSDDNLWMTAWGGGRTLYLSRYETNRTRPDALTYRVTRFDPRTGEESLLNPLDGCSVRDVSADGKTLLVHRYAEDVPGERTPGTYLADADTLKLRFVGPSFWLNRLSPDGTKAVACGYVSEDLPNEMVLERPAEPAVVDLATGRETAVKLGGDCYMPPDVTWSPDGTRWLVSRHVLLPGEKHRPRPKKFDGMWGGPSPGVQHEVILCDPDGANVTPFLAGLGGGGFDWR